jgi:hypothetical protein
LPSDFQGHPVILDWDTKVNFKIILTFSDRISAALEVVIAGFS